MKKLLITFSGARYKETTAAIVKNGPILGCDSVKVYDDKWLIEKHPEFISQRADIFFDAKEVEPKDGWKQFERKYTRGFGWFCWKPFIILDALERYCQDGDIVFFTDGDCYPIADLSPFYEYADKNGFMLSAACGFRQGHWCKKDCDDIMGVGKAHREKQAGSARYMLFKKGYEGWHNDRHLSTKKFLEMWLHFASIKKATTFEKSKNEYPDLQQHRCEQAILTNLAHMYAIPLHREFCESGNVCIKAAK